MAQSSASASIPIRVSFRPLLGGRRRSRAVRRPADRGRRPVRRGDQAKPGLLRGSRVTGSGRLERIRARIPAEIPVILDAKRADINRCGTPRRRALRRPRRGRRHGQPIPRRPGHRAALRARRPLRLRPVPDVQPRGGRVPPGRGGGSGHRRPGGTAARPRRPARGRVGARPGRSASSSARPPPRADGDPGRGTRPRFPRSGDRRAGRRHRAGPARRASDRGASGFRSRGRPRGQRLARHRARRRRDPRRRRSARPRRASRGSRRRLGFATPCATLTGAERCSTTVDPTRDRSDAAHRQEHSDAAEHRSPRAIIILVIALLILGPGKLSGGRFVARQEHPRVPEGVHGHPGVGQGRRGYLAAPGHARRPGCARRAGCRGRRRRSRAACRSDAGCSSGSADVRLVDRRELAGPARTDHGRRRRPARAGCHRSSSISRS